MSYTLNGKKVSREEFLANAPADWMTSPPMAANTYSDHDPLISDGLGCMKSQVPEMRAELERRGITGAKVLDNGQIRFTSRRARNEVCKMRGLADADAGYGDR